MCLVCKFEIRALGPKVDAGAYFASHRFFKVFEALRPQGVGLHYEAEGTWTYEVES